jgi:hypothetical protein
MDELEREVVMASLVQNERIKLIATLLNNLAVFSIAAGFLAPAFAATPTTPNRYLVMSMTGLAIGCILSGLGYHFLGHLREE